MRDIYWVEKPSTRVASSAKTTIGPTNAVTKQEGSGVWYTLQRLWQSLHWGDGQDIKYTRHISQTEIKRIQW